MRLMDWSFLATLTPRVTEAPVWLYCAPELTVGIQILTGVSVALGVAFSRLASLNSGVWV
jgi:hypothetical protein